MRTRAGLLLALVATAAALLPGLPAAAGTPGDYPEFPYPTTDYSEPQRGQFHFSPRAGWMNDVNAPLYHNGLYHLFFQHNPHGLGWDTMHWGHATSPDLVHWTQQPIALEPGVHPGDLWSGGGVVDSANTSGFATGPDAPIVVFTGTNGVSVAYSNDGGRTFQNHDGGRKVISMPANSRDPKVFWHAPTSRWVMVVWSDNGGNAALLYTSPNLRDWTFRSRYAADWLLECPDLFALPLDGTGPTKWVLTDASGEYVVGSFDGVSFTADQPTPQRMDQGHNSYFGTFYAGLTFENMPGGRVVQMAWQPGNTGGGWTGNATVPVQLGLRTYPEGVGLTRFPVAELASLRTGSQSWSERTVAPDPATDPLAGTSADTYELVAEFDTASATATRFGFDLHARADGTYDRRVTYDRPAQTLYGAPLAPVGGRVRMCILVDRGQLEIFGNDGRLSWTDNVAFDSAPTSRGIRLFAEGGAVRVVSLHLHRIGSTWGRGESTLESNLAGPWRAVGGTWTDVTGGKRGDAAGDGFYLSDSTGADLSYEADLRLETAAAAGITFRASADGSAHYTAHYTANVDAAGLVKLWRPGRDIAVHATPISRGRTYHLKVVTSGASIKVWLDHGATPVIDAIDATHTGGYLGVNVFAGTAVVQNAQRNAAGFRTNLAQRWNPASGEWTVPTGGLRGRRMDNGFRLSERTAGDLTYSGDVRVLSGRAAGLTFRASADGTSHYTVNIDTDGLVKLWRPGRDLAVHPTAIVAGRTYRLRVVATGPRIQVWLDAGTGPVIDVTDGTYVAGRLGVNVFDALAEFQDVTVG
ncbi:glycoside hydrolase family 32 protein [Micromonospora sp. 4G55]|uniref:glycoside hydrolase family 32 protein n=1 Tax=Micromonospora sp. 4G55 TaxID=2806102 RepID=UPI001A5B5176|nr:glycoside hydrolase family 32 protein [Micromonospora sp. 4G55]MBM0257057.1 glycoside hydrolase family 32 protein [Micromonospora sp. 4G55]